MSNEEVYSNSVDIELPSGTKATITTSVTISQDQIEQEVADLVYVGSTADDIAALQALYIDTNGDSWTNSEGWDVLGMDLSKPIYGVTVQNINGEDRVTRIDLRNNNISGNIDIPEWKNLTELKYVNFHLNSIESTFPSNITYCKKLEYLYLSFSNHVVNLTVKDPHEEAADYGRVHSGKTPSNENNKISGKIPSSIGNLTNLKWFSCCWGNLTGVIPTKLYMPQLKGLWLMGNKGFIEHPMPDEIGNMESITNLAIGNTAENGGREEGSVFSSWNPNLSKLTNMIDLRFEYNKMGGKFPDLSGWTKLQSIDIARCGIDDTWFPKYFLNGTMPDLVTFISNWSNGWYPDGAGFTGYIPEVHSSMAGMMTFSIAGNNISGTVPKSFFDVLGPSLVIVELQRTNLEGVREEDFNNMPNLRTLSI